MVLLPHDRHTELRCDCRAGFMKRLCWHIPKVLLAKGALEQQLLRYMGLQMVSLSEGVHNVINAMHEEAGVTDSPAKGAALQSERPPELTPAQPQPSDASLQQAAYESGSEEHAHAEPSSSQAPAVVSHKREAQALIARCAAMGQAWPNESPNWRYLALAAKTMLQQAQSMINTADSYGLEGSNSCPDFQQAPNSSAGKYLKRCKDKLEKAAGLRRAAAKRAASAAGGATMYPFLKPTKSKKPSSELEDIQQATRQLGIWPAAPAEDPRLPGYSSAPMPLTATLPAATEASGHGSDAPPAPSMPQSRRVRGKSSYSSPRRGCQTRPAGIFDQQPARRLHRRAGIPSRLRD